MSATDTPFAPAMLDVARSHLEALLSAYAVATGLGEGTIGKLVQNDPRWAPAFRTRNIGVGTYDMSVRRFSAIWPSHVAWPEAVPRQAPEGLAPEALTKLNARLGIHAGHPHQENHHG